MTTSEIAEWLAQKRPDSVSEYGKLAAIYHLFVFVFRYIEDLAPRNYAGSEQHWTFENVA